MRRIAILFAMAAAACTMAAPKLPTPLITVGMTDRPPVIDGVIDEDCWEQERPAVVHHFLGLFGREPADAETLAMLTRDEEHLYIAAVCDEPNIEGMSREFQDRDDPLWRDDCIELFFDTNRDRESYFHLVINSNGALYDDRTPGDATYDADVEAAATVEDDQWIVEASVSLASMKAAAESGDVWGFNIGREREPGEQHLSAWSPTYGKFLVPERFGTIVFKDSSVPLLWRMEDRPAFGPSKLRIATNTKQAPRVQLMRNWPVGVKYPWETPRPEVASSAEDTIGLPEEWNVTCRLVDGTEYALKIEQTRGGAVLFRQAYPIELTPEPVTAELMQQAADLHGGISASGALGDDVDRLVQQARQTVAQFAGQNLDRSSPMSENEWRQTHSAHRDLLERMRGLNSIVWTRSPLEGVQRTQMPEELYPPRTLELTACGNEVESATFVVSNPTSRTFEGRIQIGQLQFAPASDTEELAGKNLLRNGDFSTSTKGLPDGWRQVGKGAQSRIEKSPDGSTAFVLSGPEGEQTEGNFRQSVDLEPGKQYTLIAELSAEDLGSGAGQVYVINSGWTWSASVRPLTPTSGRRRYVRSFTPPESKQYDVVLRISSPIGGEVKFHSVRIIEGGMESTRFSSECISAHEVLFQELRSARTVADPIPELMGARTLMVPPQQSREVWLNVDTSGLPPGEYFGSVKLTPLDTSLAAKTLPLTLGVLPVRLPETMPIAVYNWDYARDEHYVRDLVQHHNNVFLMNTHPRMDFDEKGNPVGDADWSEYDKMLQVKLRHARNQGGSIMFSYGIVRDFNRRMTGKHGWEFMSEPWKKAFKTWVLEFERHLREDIGMDYDEYAVQLWDEATHERAEKTIEAGEFMKSFAPKIRTCMDGAQSPEEVRAMDHVIDVWIPHQRVLLHRKDGAELQEIYAELMQKGEPVWTYTCSTNMKALDPLDYYRLKPWRVWKLGLQGTCFWAYNSWRGDPWNDFDGPISDCGTIYDGATGPVSTRRWEATRDGREDYMCLHMLAKAAQKQGEKEESSTRAFIESILAEALAKPDDVKTFQKMREKLLRVLNERCGSNPPKITGGPELAVEGSAMRCAFETDVPASGRLFFRVRGNAEWRTLDFDEGTEHSATIQAPPEGRDVEWYLLLWDGRGATGFDITGLSPDGWFQT